MIPFQRFLDEHRDHVWRYLAAAVGPVDADDLFQETFISAMRAYPTLRPDSNPRAWVLTIAHRKALDHFRARKRRAVPVAELPDQGVHDGHRVHEDATWAAVDELPLKQRGAVLLRYAGDLSYAEIGVALRCSEAAARRNVFEGLAKLRKEALA